MPIINNRNSWLKDRPDSRDFKYREHKKVKMFGGIGPKVDLRSELSPIENQLDMNSCTSNSVATAIEMVNGKIDVSRLYMYWNARVYAGLEKQDIGAYFRDALKSARSGTCDECEWEYDRKNLFKKPNKKADDGVRHFIKNYYRPSCYLKQQIKDVKHAIDNRHIVVFGTTIYPSFENVRTEIYTGPKIGENILGYHAVAIVGYDSSEKIYLIRNSWGEWWGEKGYTWFPENYLFNENFNSDLWIVEA